MTEAIVGPATNFQPVVAGYNGAGTRYLIHVRASAAPNPEVCGVPDLAAKMTIDGHLTQATTSLIITSSLGPAISNLTALAADPKVNGRIVTVTPEPGVDWNTDSPCSSLFANAVVSDVAAYVADAAATIGGMGGELENVVLIGSDDVLPHARIGETQQLGKEYTYAAEVGGSNATTAAMLANNFFSDAPYADLDPILLAGKSVFVEDLGLGRLVETKDQIEAQIAQFIGTAGVLKLDTALVTGYDFLTDQANELATTLGTIATTTTQIGETFTSQNLTDALLAGPDVVSVNAHADHSRTLSAVGNNLAADPTTPPADAESLDVAKNELPAPVDGSLWFTVGCHAGFNVPNRTGQPGAPARPGDWPEYSTKAAVYIANTGYGYGDDTEVGYSERLFNSFGEILAKGGITAGDAWTQAKREYASRLSNFDAYDYKVLQQGVLYGLPMYDAPASSLRGVQGVASLAAQTNTAGPAIEPGVIGLDSRTGLQSRPVDVTYSWNDAPLTTEAFGNVAGDVEIKDGYPIVPRTSVDVTSPTPLSEVARGAIIESLESRVPVATPSAEYARVAVGVAGAESDIESSTAVFPTAFQAITSMVSGDAPTDQLVLFPGQYRGDTGEFTLLDKVSATVYYAQVQGAGASAEIVDTVKPEIVSSSADSIPGAILFKVVATDDADIARVVVQYLDAGVWRKVELSKSVLNGREFVGQLTNPAPGAGRYFIQVLDTGGNVAISSFKGNYYLVGTGLPDAVVVATTATVPVRGLTQDEWSNVPVNVQVVGTTAGDGWVPTVEQLVTAATDTTEAVYGPPVTAVVPVNGVVPLAADGVFRVTFTKDLGNGLDAVLTRIVKIDRTAPTVTFDPDVEVLFPGDVPDGALPSCGNDAPASGAVESSGCASVAEVAAVGLPTVPGATVATATDVAGNESDPVEQTIVRVSGDGFTGDWFNGTGGTPSISLEQSGALAGTLDITVTRDGVESAYDGPIVNDGEYEVVIIKIGGVEVARFEVKIDSQAPTISRPTGLKDVYTVGDPVPSLTCVASDDLSGLLPNSCTVVTGVDTSSVTTLGQPRVVVITATDVAGNTATAEFPYTVVAPPPPPSCDPAGDAPAGYAFGDVVGCSATRNLDGTASITLRLAGPIPASATPQYRLLLSASPTAVGTQVKWSNGSSKDKAVKSVTVASDRKSLTFVITLASVGVSATQTLYWSAEIQDGAPAKQNAGFLDYAPNVGLPRLTLPPR